MASNYIQDHNRLFGDLTAALSVTLLVCHLRQTVVEAFSLFILQRMKKSTLKKLRNAIQMAMSS